MDMNALDLILRRRSIRAYRPDPLTDEQLDVILRAGCNAPSAHDSRPWRFVVFRSAQGRRMLRETLSKSFAHDLCAAGFSEQERQARLERSGRIFAQAPLLILPFCKVTQPENRLAKTAETERLLATQSVALAAGQMLLAAEALGLGGCWFAAPLFCARQACEVSGLSGEEWAPQCLLTFGYPDEVPKTKKTPLPEESAVYL